MPEGLESHFEIESESTLSNEEIEFLFDEVKRIEKTVKGRDFSMANKAIAEANWLFNHPELGMQEKNSAGFLAQRLTNILGKEKVGEVGGGVYGILDGNKEDGPTIFLRGDMDALPKPDGQAAHMCGHNIHMAWLLENARLLSSYKEHFSTLPFKKIVFIGEPNEEGIASPAIGAEEMIKGGLLEKTGRPDFILAAHFVAPQVEGTVSIGKETACYGEGGFNFKFIPQGENQNVKAVEYEFIYQVGRTWQSEDPNSVVGQLRIFNDCQSLMPETIVRVTDSKESDDERRLRPGILHSSEQITLNLNEDLPKEEIDNIVQEMGNNWKNNIQIITEMTDRQLKIAIQSRGGHMAQGGPNVKFIMSKILHNLKENHNFSIADGNAGTEIAGSIRTRSKNWQEEGDKIGEKLQEIAQQVAVNSGSKIEIRGEKPKINLPPVLNDDVLRSRALNILQKAKIPITTMGLPMAPAETFVFWEKELKIPGLYIAIGGGDKEELENVKEKKLPVPGKYLHHAPAILDLIHANRAIPYGAVLSLIALEQAKNFQRQ